MTGVELGLPKSVVGWIYNHARKNYWRVAAYYELDDLIQDGLVCAYKCRNRYGTELDPPHFMSLVKTAFYNHICDLLRQGRGIDDHTKISDLYSNLTEEEILDRISTPNKGEQDLFVFIREMPEHLRKVVELYLNASEKIRLRMRVRLNGNETLSDRLFNLVGFPKEMDFETEFRAYIWSTEHVA